MIRYVHDPDDDGRGLLAVVVYRGHFPDPEPVQFLTDPREAQQIAVIAHPQGHVVQAHVHRDHERRVSRTTEVLVVQDGLIKVTLYTARGRQVQSLELSSGDVIALLSGGHEVEFVWASTILEVKQGPYAGSRELDKRELRRNEFNGPCPCGCGGVGCCFNSG